MACDVRIAAALGALRPARDQARDHPRLRRHPAPAAPGGREQGARDEPDRRADPGRGGVRVRPGQPRRRRPRAASTRRWRGRAGWPSRRRWRVAADQGGLRRRRPRRGDRGREGRLRRGPSPPRTRKEGIAAFLGKRTPQWQRTLTAVERLADLVREAGSVVALTGAGISVPSGIPDFRSPGTGLWEDVDPMEVAHIDAWRADPERFWRFYGDRFAALQDKRPNGAHAALVELERRGHLDAVVTQNIDRLHRRAGTTRLVEVHGTIDHSSCLACGAARAARRRARAAGRGARRRAALRLRRAAEARRRALRRVPARGRARGGLRAGCAAPTCCCASAPRSRSTRSPSSRASRGPTAARSRSSPRARRPGTARAAVRLDGDVVAELRGLLDALARAA